MPKAALAAMVALFLFHPQGDFSALQILSQLYFHRELLVFPLLAAPVVEISQFNTLEAMVGRPFNHLWWGVLLSMVRRLQLQLDNLRFSRSRFRVLGVLVTLRFRLMTESIR